MLLKSYTLRWHFLVLLKFLPLAMPFILKSRIGLQLALFDINFFRQFDAFHRLCIIWPALYVSGCLISLWVQWRRLFQNQNRFFWKLRFWSFFVNCIIALTAEFLGMFGRIMMSITITTHLFISIFFKSKKELKAPKITIYSLRNASIWRKNDLKTMF